MHGVYITFAVIKASLALAHGELVSSSRRVFLDVVLDEDQDVRTNNDRSLRNAKWSIELSESDFYSEHVSNLDAIGMLLYCKESGDDFDYSPESCYVSIAFSPARFESLLNSLQAGRLPEKVTASISGLKYGREPDGSTIVWDIDTSRTAPIMSISIHVPLAAIQEPFLNEFISDGIEHIPSSNTDIRILGSTLKKELEKISLSINKPNNTTAILIVILIIVMLFK